ncbi:UNVERIFIED_CONTAM: hypothetical protein FKN15_035945 [Acipenser sinensis]
MIARELDDKAAQAQCLYFFAVLANSEMNHGQAKALLEEAQSIGGDENFWFNLTLCLVKAIIEENSKDKDNMACKVFEHTISVFRSALEERPNRVTILRFMIPSLESKLVTIQIESLQHETAHVLLHPQHVKILMASCDTLNQSAKDFFKYGYKEQGVDAMLEHSKVLRCFFQGSTNPYCRMGLKYSFMFLQEWVTTGKTLGQVAMAQLESIHNLCSGSMEMRAKCLCQIGKCLRLLAVQIDPLQPLIHWDSQFVAEIKLSLKQIHVEEEHSQETNNLGDYPITHQGVLQYMSKAIRLKSYANLSINPQHLNHLNELPLPNFKIVILQHSEDRSVLYGAFLDRLKTTGKGIQQAECQLVIIFDLVQSSLSFLRQSKLDVEKRSTEAGADSWPVSACCPKAWNAE